MGMGYVPVWLGCPVCRGALTIVAGHDGTEVVGLRCSRDDLTFRVQDGVIRLLVPGEEARAERLAREYRERRLQQGWRPPTVDALCALPFKPLPEMGRVYWHVRRHSFGLLRKLIHQERSTGRLPLRPRVVDMGAGMGWLARWLATWGCEVVALDISVDPFFGLGAARRVCTAAKVNVVLVQGGMEYPPFQAGQVDLLVYNASLHYAADLQRTLHAGATVLRPEGLLVIMDTPVVQGRSVSRRGTWVGGRQLGWEDVIEVAQQVGLRIECRSNGPRWWPVYQAWQRVRGERAFRLPFLVARR